MKAGTASDRVNPTASLLSHRADLPARPSADVRGCQELAGQTRPGRAQVARQLRTFVAQGPSLRALANGDRGDIGFAWDSWSGVTSREGAPGHWFVHLTDECAAQASPTWRWIGSPRHLAYGRRPPSSLHQSPCLSGKRVSSTNG